MRRACLIRSVERKRSPRESLESVSLRLVCTSSRSLLVFLAHRRLARVSLASRSRIACESRAHCSSIVRVSFAYRRVLPALRQRIVNSSAYRFRIDRVSLAHRARVHCRSFRILRVWLTHHRTARASLARRSRIVCISFACNSRIAIARSRIVSSSNCFRKASLKWLRIATRRYNDIIV